MALEALDRAGCSPQLVCLSQELYRKTREPLGPLIALLSRETGWEIGIQVDDPLPPEVMVGQVPGWAYDMFTREGRSVFSRFLSGRTKTARWLTKHVPAKSRLDVLGSLVFTLEGGQLQQRLRWRVGDRLRHMAERECLDGCPDATEVLELLRHDFPVINWLRRDRIEGGRHG